MSEYNDLLFGESWKDLGIIKIEEDENESDDISKPEDLSLKTRSISIQTEDCMQTIIGSYFPHLSLEQIQAFLELLATLLVRKNEDQDSSRRISECYHSIVESNRSAKPAGKSGWISLEPDFAVTRSKDDLEKSKEANEGQNQARKLQVFDIKPEPPFVFPGIEDVGPTVSKPALQLSNTNTAEYLGGHLSKSLDSSYKLNNLEDSEEETCSPLPKITHVFQAEQENKGPLTNLRTVTAFTPYRIKKVSPTVNTEKTGKIPQTRDERIVKNLKIPYSVDFIINSSTEEFNELNINLNEEQRNLCRDIRRRGKNKIAAQNCRKRKFEQINSLEEELEYFSRRKEILRKENNELVEIHKAWEDRIGNLENYILKSGIDNLTEWLGSEAQPGK